MNAQSQTVTFRRSGQFLQISPPCEEVRAELRTSVHVPKQSGNGIVIGLEPDNLFRETTDLDQPAIECFCGLHPVVDKVMKAAGYSVQTDFKPPVVLPAPNVARVSETGPCDTAFLEMVRNRDRAVVKYVRGNVNLAWLIAQLAVAWPDLKIAVAVTRIDQVRWLRNDLLEYLPNVASITSRESTADELVGRVVVATYNGLGHTGVEIEKRDIVIALNAVEASRVEPLSKLGHARRARMYGFVPLDWRLSPFDKDVVRLLFGFEEMTIQKHGLAATQIEVVQFRNDGGVRLPAKISPTNLKRYGIWGNNIRNRRIAWLANRLSGDDRSEIQQCNSVIADALKGRSSLAVLVLVENVEHGNALARRLPGWPLVAAGQPWLVAATRGSKDVQPFGSSPPGARIMHAIATWQGVQALSAGGWDVVIRADGGPGLLPFVDGVTGAPILYGINNLPDQSMAVAESGTGSPIVYPINNLPDQTHARLLLVDFNDRHHPILRRWSRQRWAAYAEQGWNAPGVDPVQARVDRFLATRPQVIQCT